MSSTGPSDDISVRVRVLRMEDRLLVSYMPLAICVFRRACDFRGQIYVKSQLAGSKRILNNYAAVRCARPARLLTRQEFRTTSA